ncbi:hypothetical protein [Paenibacillus pini]|uniref:Uncharacterized protein n=1 Tax=Paenibacillus pini JCM 16418 TaxID=1236976 RepID=W7YN35_9BACL|nr:hypothetical protein [Paenibacillus pini]GAF09043.1 hypothetical protein JCM16418_3160 [Paenibacillus pini JCM 16418]
MQISPELQHALQDASRMLSGAGNEWLLGGSCGLLLQHVHLDQSPNDIDIYADRDSVLAFHEALVDCCVDGPLYSETAQYRSLLSHYQLNAYQMELVGGFSVRTEGSLYEVEIRRLLYPAAVEIQLGSHKLLLMPLAHELLFNVLRSRADRYEAIATEMRKELNTHLPLMVQLIESNRLSNDLIAELSRLLESPALLKYCGVIEGNASAWSEGEANGL